MPELPEVETIRGQLTKSIIGLKINLVEIKLPKIVFFNNKKSDDLNFKKNIEGSTVKDINRRSKILIIELSTGYTLLIHLKMTGQLIYRDNMGDTKMGGHPWPPSSVSVPNKWTHVIFYFSNKSVLYFNDVRQFGYLKLVPSDELYQQKEIKHLGPEPLENEFNLKIFTEILKKRSNSKIKPLLIDQHFLSGVGNIYADESLHFAKILPTRIVKSLKKEEIKNLFNGIISIMQKSIAKGGTSSDTYVTLTGEKGGFKKYLKVYGRENLKCFRCQGIIKRTKINSRSAHFCPKCQR